jgi:glycosyl transferase family 25
MKHPFASAYLINLPERTDRLKSAQAELDRLGWDVEVFPGRRFQDAAGFQNPGIRGCFNSHLDCLRQATGDVLILEDDITFASVLGTLNLQERIQSLDWDFLYLGHEQTPFARAHKSTSDVRFEPWGHPILCTHFHAIRERMIPRVISHMEAILRRPPGDPEGGPMSVDGAHWVFRERNPEVKTFVANPKLGWQRPSRSDLRPRGFDKVLLLRPALGLARKVKHALERWGA